MRKYKFREKVSENFTKLKFSLTAKPEQHLKMLIENLNAPGRDTGWEAGKCIDAVEKTVAYSHSSCDDVLNMIADAFETEWEIDEKTVDRVKIKTINLCKVEHNTGKDDTPVPLALSYGKGNGFLPGVGRSNHGDKAPVGILYVQGGEKNINYNTYLSKELLLPRGEEKERILEYEDRKYISSEDGLSIQRYDKKPLYSNEDSLDCVEIYPGREHTVTEVFCIEEDSKWDIVDIDNNIDYSGKDKGGNNYRIDGERVTIIFQSGMLAGREFELVQTENSLTGYVHSEKRFKLVSQEVDGQTMPNKTFAPKKRIIKDGKVEQEGDKFKVFGISLPPEYICNNADQSGASWDMFKEAARYMYENENPQYSFTGKLDGIWAKRNWEGEINVGGKIEVGAYIHFSDAQFHPEGTLIRIVGITQNINNPHSPTLELSNVPVTSSIYYDLAKIETNEVLVEDNHKKAIQYAKRGWRDAKETISMLEESLLEDFTESINPITIQTMSLLAGDESLQFQFVDKRYEVPVEGQPVPAPPRVIEHTADATDPKQLVVPEGVIQHLTLDVDSVSLSNKPSEYKYWKLAASSFPLEDPSKKHWLYAKVTNDCRDMESLTEPKYQGIFVRSDKPIIMEAEGYYYLLVGLLNSENAGIRNFVKMYGFTEILPGRITTEMILSADGKTYFDLKNGEIGGKIVFRSTSGKNRILSDLEGDAKTAKDAGDKGIADAKTAKDAADKGITDAKTAKDAADKARQALIDKSEEIAKGVIAHAKTDGFSVIDGGLVMTNHLELRPVKGTETAGMSGENAGDSPAFWAGGTYAEARAKTANIVLGHSGEAKIGQLWIEDGGTLQIRDTRGKDLITLSNSNIETLEQIAEGSHTDFVEGFDESRGWGSPDVSKEPVTPILEVLGNNSTMRIQASLYAHATPTKCIDEYCQGGDSCAARSGKASITLFLADEHGVPVLHIAEARATADTLPLVLPVDKTITVQPGKYQLRVSVDNKSHGEGKARASIDTIRMDAIYAAVQKRNVFGKDGLLLAYDKDNLFRMAVKGDKLDVTIRSEGNFDIPGVLAAGSVASGGLTSHRWGAKSGTSQQGILGTVTVKHDIKHLEYFVQLTSIGNYRCVVKSKATDRFVVNIYGNSGSAAEAAFDYAVMGNNK